MPLAEKIQSAQDELIALLDLQTPLAKKLAADEELNDEEEAENQRIDTEKAAIEKRLNMLRSAERTLSGNANVPALRPNGSNFTPNAPAIIHRDGRVQFERGLIGSKARPADILLRLAVVHFKSFVTRRALIDIAKETYPERTDIDAVFKAVTNPAVTTVAGWAAELVDTAILDFLEALLPVSVYAQLRDRGIRFSFGRNGQIRIPRRNRPRNAPGDLRGAFVGEGNPIPVRRGSFGSITLIPHKMGVISTYSREMAQQSTPQIESLIREGIVEDTADAIDQALLDNVAGDAIRPAGLLNGITPVAGATTGTLVEKITADVAAALAPFIAANAADGLVWLMNPANAFKASWATTPLGTWPFRDQIAAGGLAGYPIIQSTNVPTTKLMLVRARDFVSSTDDTPEFDVSDVATIHEDDGGYPADQAMRPGTSTVLPIVSDPAGIPPLATATADPVRSLWQTASIGIRMLLGMDWAMRRPGMMVVIDPIAW